jgi:hypothetical protein
MSETRCQSTPKACTCGNQACAVRAAHGLVPFCQMPAPTPTAPAGFASFADADAVRKPGQSVIGVRSGMGHGPLRYIIRGRAA